MSSIFEALGALQQDEAAQLLSQQFGTDQASTGKLVAAALPTLIGAVSRNASSQDGAESLLSALDRKHDGGALDDLLGALAGAGDSGRQAEGTAILDHMLGGQRSRVEDQLGRSSGLDGATVASVLGALAPLVLAALGRAKNQNQLDAGGLSQTLGREREQAEVASPGSLGLFEKLLDSDGDGEISDDVAQLGAQFLGRYLSA